MAVGVSGLGSRRSVRAMRVKTVLRCVKRTFAARGTLDSPRLAAGSEPDSADVRGRSASVVRFCWGVRC
jgi:hypothetical protein